MPVLPSPPSSETAFQADPVWTDPVVAILPSRHPLAAKSEVELREIAREPLVLCGGEQPAWIATCELEAALLAACDLPNVVDRAENQQVQLTLVARGYGLGLVLALHAETIQRSDIVVRPLPVHHR